MKRVQRQFRGGFVLPGCDWLGNVMLQHYCHCFLHVTDVRSSGMSAGVVQNIGFLIEPFTDGIKGRHTACCLLQGVFCEVGAHIH